MKKIIFLIIFLLVTNQAMAYWVIYDKDTKEVYTVAEEDNTVVPDGMVKEELSGELKNQEFPAHPSNCKFKNGAFIVNNEKINKQYQAEQARKEKQEELNMIEKQIKLDALKELKKKGKKFNHISEKDFE